MPGDLSGTFTPAYAGSVRYFAALMSCRGVFFDDTTLHLKAPWCCHHCRILGPNGVQTLTVPIVKMPYGEPFAVKNIQISEHGDWRRIHWGAIFSAYGKSPFFDYFAPDLHALFEHGDRWLIDFDRELFTLITSFLDLPVPSVPSVPTPFHDFRGMVGDKHPDTLPAISNVPYWQVWDERFDFVPDLSILDLLMNTGREAILTLRNMAGIH